MKDYEHETEEEDDNEKKEKTDTPTTKRGGAFPFLQCWARWNS